MAEEEGGDGFEGGQLVVLGQEGIWAVVIERSSMGRRLRNFCTFCVDL